MEKREHFKDINDLNHELRHIAVGDKSLDIKEHEHNVETLDLPKPRLKIKYSFHHEGNRVEPESHWAH